MLGSIRSWFARRYAPRPWPTVAGWAQARQLTFKAKPEGDGFIVANDSPADPWRLEWGPSQRRYLEGFELRLRATLAEGDPAHMLLLSRRLMQRLEAEVFRQYTDELQTRIDGATPDEMRWLVLYPKLQATELGVLRERFGATGHPRAAVQRWVGGALGPVLANTPAGGDDDALVIVVQRGRLTLRTPMARPDLERIERLLALFRAAAREARQALGDAAPERDPPSTHPGLWARSEEPGGVPPA
jgi:hypothetical protein